MMRGKISSSVDCHFGSTWWQKSCFPSGFVCSVGIGCVLDGVVGKRLADCPYFKRVLFSRECSPSVVHFWNMCDLDKAHCDFHGKRLKFESYGIDSLRVVSICPKVVGLPLESV
jgi:hypothetical protein